MIHAIHWKKKASKEKLIYAVHWKKKGSKEGWNVPVGKTFYPYLFSKKKLDEIPRDLRSPYINKFDDIFLHTEFSSRMRELFAMERDNFFLLKFPDGAWEIPWELLLKNSFHPVLATSCLVRDEKGRSKPEAPELFDEKMRILILKGASNGLNLDKEVKLIQKSWKNLEKDVKDCIEKPIAVEANKADLETQLREHRPHLLWFSGHGRSDPKVQVLFADKTWISAKKLANTIKKSNYRPLYAVFWACDTAKPDRIRELELYSPSLYKSLKKIGFLSVLVMQSPIRDSSAIVMSQHLFRYLAVGLPLEKAVARTRAYLRDHPPRGAHPLDWASPVVWSAGVPVDRLQWNADKQRLAQFQVLGRHILAWGRAESSAQQLDAPVSQQDISRAQSWLQKTHIWIQADINESEHLYYWLRTLQAILSQRHLSVISVELDSEDPERTLKEWAESVHKRMLPGDFPDDIAQLINEITNCTVGGWRKLCALEGIYLAIANPPPLVDEAHDTFWFWKPLLSNENNIRVGILSDQQIPTMILENKWVIDRIGETVESQAIEIVANKAPRLARAIALLNMPLKESYLSFRDECEGEVISFSWGPEWDKLMIRTAAGPTMAATARKHILRDLKKDELEKAHMDCVKILTQPGLQRNEKRQEHLLTHLLEAGKESRALDEATILCQIYRDMNRPYAVLRVVKRIKDLRDHLPMKTRLIIAWANMYLGKIEYARHWLLRSEPTEPLDIAWKHGLLAELYKSEGVEYSKEKTLEEIKKAIEICEEARRKSPHDTLIQIRYRAYRQDLARIKHYLFYDLEEAADEYERLVREWSSLPNPGVDLAIVKRNYAECLLSLAEKPGDSLWGKARDLLEEAEELARCYPYLPVLSEILYEKARILEKEEKWVDAYSYLEKCKDAALLSRHYMLFAIAENRLFWRKEEFSLDRWNDIASDLRGFPHHGWAVRTLINSRLRVAKILEEGGNLSGSLEQLETNVEDLIRNPAFDRGSDRFRIAATMAGLQVISNKMNRRVLFWQDFISKYSWAEEWLKMRSLNNAEELWKEVK